MRHTRLDSLLLAGVGTLAAHEIAYLPGSMRASLGGTGVSHAHIPLLWGVGGTLAVVVLAKYVVTSLRSRRGHRWVDPRWLGLTMGALYVSQEAAERALSGSPAVSLLTEWVLWLGLAAIPVVAVVLSRLARCIVDFVAGCPTDAVPTRGVAPIPSPAFASPAHPLAQLAHSLARRGPPLPTAF